MHRDPKTIHDGIQSGDLARLSRMLKPVTNAEIAELMLRGTEAEANSPAAPELPDEAPPMDQHEWEVRKAMIALTELPEGDHEARARQWEHLAELCFSAADVEWRKAKAASRDPITGRVVG